MPFSPRINTRPLVGAAERHLLAQVGHRRALADHDRLLLAIDLGAQDAVLRFEIALAQGVAHHQHRLFERQRLLDEIERAHLDGADRRLDVAVAGNDHDLRIDLPFAQPLQRGQAVETRQPDVEHDHVEGRAVGFLEALFAGAGGIDVEAFVLEDSADRRAHAGFIVNDKNGRHQAGNSMINRVPVGTLSVTSMLPPCSATMRRTMARPRPLPRPLVE